MRLADARATRFLGSTCILKVVTALWLAVAYCSLLFIPSSKKYFKTSVRKITIKESQDVYTKNRTE